MSRFRRATALAAAALLLGTGTVAYADNLQADGDGLVPVNSGRAVALGDIACGEEITASVLLTVVRAGSGQQTYADSAVVSIVGSADITGVTASATSITLPDNWVETPSKDSRTSDVATSTVSVLSTTEGPGSAEFTFSATGAGADTKNPIVTRKAMIDVTWNTLECITNTAPSALGVPVASSSVNQGGFTLAWDAATDAEGDAVTYTLEGKDAGDADFGVIASGLTATDYTFGADKPTEGTWTYRVKAVESGTSPALESGYSGTSEAVKVDQTGPNAPTAAADRAAEYVDGATSWWKDSVTVSFTPNGDPDLSDGSDGSGVDFVSGPETISGDTNFEVTGTATDKAGNVSAGATVSGNVDSTKPVVSAVEPSTAFIKGSTATIAWTAGDEGSGLATEASGSITVDTSTVGTHTVTIPAGTAIDNVGHESAAVEVIYSVVYDFNGFFKPVDMGTMNVVNKAGSAIPLKFSLDGYQGMDVITSAKFRVSGVQESGDLVEEIATAGQSGLSYDADADQYVYVWKTDKAWAGKSGVLTVTLNDGTTHTVEFSFKK